MGPEEIAPGLTRLGNDHFALYLAGPEENRVLIEAGVGAVAPLVFEQVGTLGLKPQTIRALVLTHAHFDHVMDAAALVRAWPHLEVWASARTAETLGQAKTLSRFAAEDEHLAEVYLKEGRLERRPDLNRPETMAVDRVLDPGEVLDLGRGQTLEVIDAPGHCPGGLAFWLAGPGALLVSDSLGFFLPPSDVCPLYLVSLTEYLATMARLRAYPAHLLGLAHQGHFGLPERISWFFDLSLTRALEVHHTLCRDLAAGRDPDRIGRQVFERFYYHELTIYTEENIRRCAELLLRRSQEADLAGQGPF